MFNSLVNHSMTNNNAAVVTSTGKQRISWMIGDTSDS